MTRRPIGAGPVRTLIRQRGKSGISSRPSLNRSRSGPADVLREFRGLLEAHAFLGRQKMPRLTLGGTLTEILQLAWLRGSVRRRLAALLGAARLDTQHRDPVALDGGKTRGPRLATLPTELDPDAGFLCGFRSLLFCHLVELFPIDAAIARHKTMT
jgi:hypothetical protein